MNRIKFIIVMLLASTVWLCSYAGQPTTEDVENYKASIMSFVKSEGYMPKFDSDGDISFKSEGTTYWIEVSSYDDGYYVSLTTYGNVDGYSIGNVRKAMDETARSLKFVRLYTLSPENHVEVSYSWYCVSITDFKRMFSNSLFVVSTAYSRFGKKLKEE